MSDCLAFMKNLFTDERGCWSAAMLPRKAPEWYRKLVSGVNASDVHQQAPPFGSFFLLGFVSLSVPDDEKVRVFYWHGCGMSDISVPGEFRAEIGASQIRMPVNTGSEPQVWPGELRLWVKDIRETQDQFNSVNHVLNELLDDEKVQAMAGGEFASRYKDPFHKNFVLLSEAPEGFAEKLHMICAERDRVSMARGVPLGKVPPQGAGNALCLIEAQVALRDRALVAAAGDFYEKMLGAKVTRKMTVYERQAIVDTATLHFGPSPDLHQTMVFEYDPVRATPNSNLGSICFYVCEESLFRLAFVKCKLAGQVGDQTWERVKKTCEFTLPAIIDPVTKSEILSIKHVIRHSTHPECPLEGKECQLMTVKGQTQIHCAAACTDGFVSAMK
eukprot:TRINITY_DN19390_c0_g1_i1.p1 TRINITY_DN19390_c0_g1~~TRINITY_DN19390_c0_g1_i1.p1  ORF type:complete len:387 (-),score=72.91 TRINITY_DN19390_c0_g1_i1:446-1606(-)